MFVAKEFLILWKTLLWANAKSDIRLFLHTTKIIQAKFILCLNTLLYISGISRYSSQTKCFFNLIQFHVNFKRVMLAG